MLDYKIALALTAETVEELKKGEDRDIITEREDSGNVRTIETPDGDYKILLWDWKSDMRMNDAYNHLLNSIECIRHALIEITEDGSIWRDVETEDADGCDEIFEEILGWKADIVLWNDPNDVLI